MDFCLDSGKFEKLAEAKASFDIVIKRMDAAK